MKPGLVSPHPARAIGLPLTAVQAVDAKPARHTRRPQNWAVSLPGRHLGLLGLLLIGFLLDSVQFWVEVLR